MKHDIRDTAAAKSLSAYVILKGGREVATVRAHFSNGGRCTVNVWQRSAAADRSRKAATRAGEKLPKVERYSEPLDYQAATAGGYGYDKFTAALRGMWIDGHRMGDHSSTDGAPKPPRGLKFYPSDFKAPKGYSLANYGTYDTATGQRVDSYSWNEKARAELGDSAEWDAVEVRARDLRNAAAESGATVGGYGSCFKESGLKFLEAKGYRVIQAL